MAEKEINITYETLFDLLRREKNRPELQKLSDSFLEDVNEYIRQKKSILKGQQIKIGMSASAEKENTEKQIENIKSMLNNLFDRRQQKIIQMAIIKAKTSSNPNDYNSLLNQEHKLFNSLAKVLSSFRQELFSGIDLEEKQEPDKEESKKQDEGKKEESKEKLQQEQEKTEEKQEKEKKKEYEEESWENKEQKTERQQEETKLIRFIYSVPSFVGRNLEVYGPFEEDDTATLPEEIADILITKGRAEEIKK
jgi:DNA replication initiation complex subunit (GINS family)